MSSLSARTWRFPTSTGGRTDSPALARTPAASTRSLLRLQRRVLSRSSTSPAHESSDRALQGPSDLASRLGYLRHRIPQQITGQRNRTFEHKKLTASRHEPSDEAWWVAGWQIKVSSPAGQPPPHDLKRSVRRAATWKFRDIVACRPPSPCPSLRPEHASDVRFIQDTERPTRLLSTS